MRGGGEPEFELRGWAEHRLSSSRGRLDQALGMRATGTLVGPSPFADEGVSSNPEQRLQDEALQDKCNGEESCISTCRRSFESQQF
jgi:hypothetical protein